MSEEKLMKEIRANGPVTMDFQAAGQFMAYYEGIMLDADVQHLEFLKGESKEDLLELQKDG
jgi:hypothetical protein